MTQGDQAYWNYFETSRHNSRMESLQHDANMISQQNATSQRISAQASMLNAQSNALNAATNAYNAEIARYNSQTNRLQYDLAESRNAWEQSIANAAQQISEYQYDQKVLEQQRQYDLAVQQYNLDIAKYELDERKATDWRVINAANTLGSIFQPNLRVGVGSLLQYVNSLW